MCSSTTLRQVVSHVSVTASVTLTRSERSESKGFRRYHAPVSTPAPDLDPPGPLAPLLWGGIAVFLTCAGLGGVLLAVSDSESNGITASMVVAFPLGFVWAGALAAIVLFFMKRTSRGIRIGAPFGCGCLGGMGLAAIAVLFFAVIFPEL